MGLWKKSPVADPNVIAQLQQRVNADPRVQNFQFVHSAGGPVKDAQAKSKLVKQILGSALPDGYDVSQDGEIVYTNKTPGLRQLAMASLPIAAPFAAEALIGAAAGGAASAGGATAAGAGAAPTVAASSGFWSPSTIGLLNMGIGAGTQLLGAKMQSGAADRAADIQARSAAESLAFLKDQDAKDRAQYLEERARGYRLQDEREGRLAPFRAGAADGYQALSGLLKVPQGGIRYAPPVSRATTRRLADLA